LFVLVFLVGCHSGEDPSIAFQDMEILQATPTAAFNSCFPHLQIVSLKIVDSEA
jgi:hypothetical protein